MEMILSGAYFMDAREAVARGLASRVVEGGPEKLLTAAVELAKKIAR
jgi:enoyl-CoA hydratase/carnithine racemase